MGYSYDSRIRFSELGEDRRLSVNSIVDYFQDCAIFHSEKVEQGLETLEKRNKAWVLSSWQIVVSQRPGIGTEVNIGTSTYDFKGFYGYRNFLMETKEKELVAMSNSIWVYMDLETKAPARIVPEEILVYGQDPRLDMEYAPRKIVIPGESVAMDAFMVQRYHLDVYHHVNNGQYVRMASAYIPGDFEIHQMRAEYKNQAILGSVIVPMVHEKDGVYTVTLADQQGQPYAVVEFR